MNSFWVRVTFSSDRPDLEVYIPATEVPKVHIGMCVISNLGTNSIPLSELSSWERIYENQD